MLKAPIYLAFLSVSLLYLKLISYVIDLNRHLALLPLISPPYILNFGCQPYSIIYGGFFHRLSFSLLIRLAYGFYRKLRFL